jgi:uncharacterized protein YqcC (DUF446 family)
MNPPYEEAAQKADAIEQCLRSINRWQAEPLADNAFENMGDFGGNTMRFEQWLQFILVPTIRDIVTERAAFPPYSQVGRYAVQVLDADPEARPLITLLQELDLIIGGEPPEGHTEGQELGAIQDLPFPVETYHQIDSLLTIDLSLLDSTLSELVQLGGDQSPPHRQELANLLFHTESSAQPAARRLKIRKAAMKLKG